MHAVLCTNINFWYLILQNASLKDILDGSAQPTTNTLFQVIEISERRQVTNNDQTQVEYVTCGKPQCIARISNCLDRIFRSENLLPLAVDEQLRAPQELLRWRLGLFTHHQRIVISMIKSKKETEQEDHTSSTEYIG